MLLIDNALVYAPAPLGRRSLLLGGGKVLWMGTTALELPAVMRNAVETLDLEGRRLIPGLIDGHVHICGGGGEAGFSTRVPPLPLSGYTSAGITTVIGLLGTDDVARGPRELLATVYALREEGLNAWALVGGYHLPIATLTGSLRGDLVFLEPFVGVGELAISDHRSSQPTLEELLRVASDAHVAGLMTGRAGILHLHLGDGARGLELVNRALDASELPARVFNPTHVNRRRALFDEAVELARRGAVVDVTAFPVGEDEDGYGAAEAVERFLASGAPAGNLTVSSDAGGCLPCFDTEGRVCRMGVGSSGALLATLRALLERGLPLADALPPFTSNPARLLRLATKGSIEPGADADLVALDSGGGAHTVIVRGKIHVADGTAVRRGTFEATAVGETAAGGPR
jgi:beta-aspartyl-dipeptidase (metallo-type)